MMIQNLSSRLASYITTVLDQQENQPVINYGLQIFIGAFLKIISLVTFSYILGIFLPTVMIIISACLFRAISGGVHCSGYWRCFLATHLVFLPLGYISSILQFHLSTNQIYNIYYFSFPILLVAIYFWAPGEHAERIFSVRRKRLSKIISTIFIILIYILVINTKYQYSLPVLLGLIWQGFTFTPMGYWFMGTLDKLLSFKIREVGSC